MSTDGVLGPLVAFLAGVLSFVSPCVLPLVPVYLAQLAGTAAEAGGGPAARRATFAHAVSFVTGFGAVFVLLGASLGLAGAGLRDHQRLLAEAAGVLIIVMGLHLVGLLRIPLLYRTYTIPMPERTEPAGQLAAVAGTPGAGAARYAAPVPLDYGRSVVVGAGFALGWTPCIGPVLGSILGLAAAQGTVARGAVLLLFYSLGLGVPFLAAGLAVGTMTAYLKRLNRFLPAIETASGVLLVAAGVLLFAGRLTMFNQYFDFFGLGSRGL